MTSDTDLCWRRRPTPSAMCAASNCGTAVLAHTGCMGAPVYRASNTHISVRCSQSRWLHAHARADITWCGRSISNINIYEFLFLFAVMILDTIVAYLVMWRTEYFKSINDGTSSALCLSLGALVVSNAMLRRLTNKLTFYYYSFTAIVRYRAANCSSLYRILYTVNSEDISATSHVVSRPTITATTYNNCELIVFWFIIFCGFLPTSSDGITCAQTFEEKQQRPNDNPGQHPPRS